MSHVDQVEYWNGRAGRNWAEQAEQLDCMLGEFCKRIIGKAGFVRSNEALADIGCGAGAVSLAIAEASEQPGLIFGIDISEPLLEVARQRAKRAKLPVNFFRADASSYRSETLVDTMVSRFGVMFFDDPVSAFANLRQSVKASGRLVFACWQSIKLNGWASAPLRAAIPLLKEALPAPDPIAPGPFAFADKDRVNFILSESGWSSIDIESINTRLRLPGNNIEESAKFMMTLGPLARVLLDQGLEEAPVKSALIKLLSQHQLENGEIWMDAASWLVSCESKRSI